MDLLKKIAVTGTLGLATVVGGCESVRIDKPMDSERRIYLSGEESGFSLSETKSMLNMLGCYGIPLSSSSTFDFDMAFFPTISFSSTRYKK